MSTSESLNSSLPSSVNQVAAKQALPLRLWPGVVMGLGQWVVIKAPVWLDLGILAQFLALFWMPMLAAVGIVTWWLFFSRLAWSQRFTTLAVFAVTGGITAFAAHESNRMGLVMYGLPTVTSAWVVWLLVSGALAWPPRQAVLWLVMALTWGYQALLRMDGVDGEFGAQISWRWQPTAEDRFLAERAAPSKAGLPAEEKLAETAGDWNGFRGPMRNGKLPGVRLESDWTRFPPKQVWRQRVGPGWSSFAVIGDRIFTQEQRGEDEVVVCYEASSGSELWVHADATRFMEVVAGPGPRATPQFHAGKIYSFGANGRLNCLNAATGSVVWSRDITADYGAKPPMWGFSASPLVVQGVVSVFAGSEEGTQGVLAYHAETGEPVWSNGPGKHSYCSMHRLQLAGVEQLAVTTEAGLTAFDPTSGKQLWHFDWSLQEGLNRVLQPLVTENGDLLLATWMKEGTRRLRVTQAAGEWQATEVWATKSFSPYYSDMVDHQGFLYGIDGSFFKCLNLEDGSERYRVRAYGNGQLLLLPDQNALLVLSEKGELALVETNPERHVELAKFQALEGKTWNHPVFARGRLYVRNGEEMACYELTRKAE